MRDSGGGQRGKRAHQAHGPIGFQGIEMPRPSAFFGSFRKNGLKRPELRAGRQQRLLSHRTRAGCRFFASFRKNSLSCEVDRPGFVSWGAGAGTQRRRRTSSLLSSSTPSTVSPRTNYMALAKAAGKLTHHCWLSLRWSTMRKHPPHQQRPSGLVKGPNTSVKRDLCLAKPRGMRGNSRSREPAQKGSPRPRPGGNPWDERPEENRVSPRASAGGNPRARGEFAHPRASGFSRGGGNGLKGLTIVYAAR